MSGLLVSVTMSNISVAVNEAYYRSAQFFCDVTNTVLWCWYPCMYLTVKWCRNTFTAAHMLICDVAWNLRAILNNREYRVNIYTLSPKTRLSVFVAYSKERSPGEAMLLKKNNTFVKPNIATPWWEVDSDLFRRDICWWGCPVLQYVAECAYMRFWLSWVAADQCFVLFFSSPTLSAKSDVCIDVNVNSKYIYEEG